MAIAYLSKQILKQSSSNREKIEQIVYDSRKEHDTDKLLGFFNALLKFDNTAERLALQKAKEEYEEAIEKYEVELEKAYEEVRESSENIIQNFDNLNDSHELFREAGYQLNISVSRLKQQYKDIIQNLKTKDYIALKTAYAKLKSFVTQIIDARNKRYRNSWGNNDIVFSNGFINPREITKPTLQKPKVEYKSYATAEEALKHVLNMIAKDSNTKIYYTLHNNADSVLPQIIWYDNNEHISNKDLIATPKDLEHNKFLQSLFSVIHKKISGILTAYEKSKTTPGYLMKTEEEINKKLENIVTKRFNTLFAKYDATHNRSGYRFSIKLEENKIALCIFKDDDVMELDMQSDGFRWFFNLFFFLHGRGLQEGDIVIMDEPAYNLSIPARRECRDFLKSYGEKHGITFCVVTHDPFLLHIDYLDEIRIVEINMQGEDPKGAVIVNDFAKIKSNDTDALKKIKRAFGIETYAFYAPGIKRIYVEGITDYCYLTAFKILWQREHKNNLDIAFLPIGGLSTQGNETKILDSLLEQEKEPILLVDNDKAGEAIIKTVSENAEKYQRITLVTINGKITTITIKDNKSYVPQTEDLLDTKEFEGFTTIENLFTKKDIEKYGLSEKRVRIASAFKRKILCELESQNIDETTQNNNNISKTTKKNFYKFLEALQDM